jgi:hypothetical protein
VADDFFQINELADRDEEWWKNAYGVSRGNAGFIVTEIKQKLMGVRDAARVA